MYSRTSTVESRDAKHANSAAFRLHCNMRSCNRSLFKSIVIELQFLSPNTSPRGNKTTTNTTAAAPCSRSATTTPQPPVLLPLRLPPPKPAAFSRSSQTHRDEDEPHIKPCKPKISPPKTCPTSISCRSSGIPIASEREVRYQTSTNAKIWSLRPLGKRPRDARPSRLMIEFGSSPVYDP